MECNTLCKCPKFTYCDSQHVAYNYMCTISQWYMIRVYWWVLGWVAIVADSAFSTVTSWIIWQLFSLYCYLHYCRWPDQAIVASTGPV